MSRHTRTLGVVAVAVLLASVTTAASGENISAGEAAVTVQTGVTEGRVPTAFLGANHRYSFDGYRIWDAAADRPDPDAVARIKAMGVTMLRWPGGTLANTLLWKGTIGKNRDCQRDGRMDVGKQDDPADDVLDARYPAYGLNEHLRFAAAVGAQTQVMVPMAIGTARDAADLVEYLNTPAGDEIKSVHKGYVDFRAAMRAVDPDIAVCASWGRPVFAGRFEQLKGTAIPADSRYDCLTTHPYTHFQAGGMDDWDSAVEGHDWQMIGAGQSRDEFTEIRSAVRDKAANEPSVAISESGALWGPHDSPIPAYTYAMTHALYMATQWIDWLELGVPWVEANDLSSNGMYTLLGRGDADGLVTSAEGVTREAVRPMLAAGGQVLGTTVGGNPERTSPRGQMCDGKGTPQDLCAKSYPLLKVMAVRAQDGTVHVMVVNRSPDDADTVQTRIALQGFTGNGRASVRQVAPAHFTSANTRTDRTAVSLRTSCRDVGADGFTAAVPAHSVTLFSLPPQDRAQCS